MYKALGIFGVLDPQKEAYFQGLQKQFSRFPVGEDPATFNHLSLVIDYQVPENNLNIYQNFLPKLAKFLPLEISIIRPIIIDRRDLALEFDPGATAAIRDQAAADFPGKIITTSYIKVIRYVFEEDQPQVLSRLSDIKSLTISNFVLTANSLTSSGILAKSV